MWKRLRGRRRAWLLIPLVLVVAAGSGVWLLTKDDSSAAASSTTETVSSQTIQQTVSADGTIAARRTADDSFAVSGTVTRVAVDEGDTVKKGDVLATVDREALVATRTAAASSLDAAITQLDDDYDDDASDVQIAADKANIVSARATLADAREAVDDATLRATVSGTVTDVGIKKGDSVGSSSSSSSSSSSTGMSDSSSSSSTTDTSGTISIVSTSSFVVDATVAAEDADQLKKGLQAEITATGVDDTVYGTVSEVGLVAQTNDSGAAVFPVTIEVTGKQKDLYAGVSATASIVVKQVEDVLTVPSRALTTEDGATYVTKVVDGKEVKTAVETGEAYGMSTEVTKGLEEGDTVVIPGFTMPTGSGSTGEQQQEGFPGGGQMPDVSQMGGGGQMPGGGQ
ncbi:efflux RND transporter periplasmic adaptor subunit [Nocardioides mangrovi]|uniref:Efflux RND transporter periplasmic adaptor subunit n=1 Tax=Nocardioides mangrovi TaxID=2874580 RepID=A0ABS7U7M4_9ACTN|nr:biotin/lipoyl-binding protein [Nocardioides mangrovi]MBZ5736731.1 efflux RND transporter periplasmic adaptor subunit [Nocardioides mangrovi]